MGLKRNDIQLWVGAFFCFNVLQPAYMWSFASLSNTISLGIILLLCIHNIKQRFIMNFSKVLYSLVFVILSFLSGRNMLSTLGTMLLFFVMLTNEEYLTKVYDRFITIFTYITALSFIVYILVQIHVPISYSIINPLNPLQEVTYKSYPFLVTINNLDYYRFMGLFDEPGVMGTICGVLLLMSKCNFKDRRNILLLVYGIASFSLFFYLILGAYVLLFAKTKYKVIVICSVVVVLFLLPKSQLLDDYIFYRLSFENGKMVGDDRKVWNFNDIWYEQYKQSSDYYWGLGRDAKQIYNSGGSSYIDLLIMYGLVYTVFFCFVFIYDAYKRIKPDIKSLAVYLLIFTAVMYQRPYITNIGYILMLYMPIIYLSKKTENIENGERIKWL